MSFPDAERVEDWYLIASDGIRNLASLLHTNEQRYISEHTHNQIFGMTPSEWRAFHDRKQEDNELAACLALLAAVEGAIRRDLEHRVTGHGKHHLGLQDLAKPNRHVSIVKILQRWAKIISTSYAHKQLKQLEQIYRDRRNILAHGRAQHGQFTFAPIFNQLRTIERKWKEAVSDFRGF